MSPVVFDSRALQECEELLEKGNRHGAARQFMKAYRLRVGRRVSFTRGAQRMHGTVMGVQFVAYDGRHCLVVQSEAGRFLIPEWDQAALLRGERRRKEQWHWQEMTMLAREVGWRLRGTGNADLHRLNPSRGPHLLLDMEERVVWQVRGEKRRKLKNTPEPFTLPNLILWAGRKGWRARS